MKTKPTKNGVRKKSIRENGIHENGIREESVVVDHSISGLELAANGEGRASISKDELGCLLMFLNNLGKIYKDNRTIPITILGHELYFCVDKNISVSKSAVYHDHADASFKFKRLSEPSEVPDGWKYAVDTVFSNSSTNETTQTVEISVYRDKAKRHFNTKFTLYANKRNKTYYLNANCSPTQLLTGDNSLPLGIESTSNKAKAEFFIKLFILPFIFVSTIFKDHVFKKGCGCEFLTNVETNNIILPKTQFAAYSDSFKTVQARALAIETIYQVYSASIRRHDINHSVDIPSVLGYKLEQDKSTIRVNKHGAITDRSGFMLRFSKTNQTPTFSIGFYAKDVVNKIKKEAANVAVGNYGIDFTREYPLNEAEQRVYDLVHKSIRFDLSIHKHGFVEISNYLHELYPSIDTISPSHDIFAKDILNFLIQVMDVDPTLSILFHYVFQKEMRMDQLFFTTHSQWRSAFDSLKERGLADLVGKLKNRQKLKQGESWSSLYAAATKKTDASHVKRLIDDKTTIVNEDGEIRAEGIDIAFPYRVYQEAKSRVRSMFINLDDQDEFYETGTLPNHVNPKEIDKKALQIRRKVYHYFVNRPVRKMPIQVNRETQND